MKFPQTTDRASHLVILDASLPDKKTLVGALPDFACVHFIHENEDALSQVAAAASNYESLKGLHILGHGKPGQMLLGGKWIDIKALGSKPENMMTISAALAEDANVWLYGCHSARGEAGQRWLDAWALTTGVSAHGSDDVVGTAECANYWKLGHTSDRDNIEEPATPNEISEIFSQSGWAHLLAANTPPTFTISDGKLIIAVGSDRDYGNSVIQQLDGKIVLVGSSNWPASDFSLIRLNSDGTLDSRFGNSGKLLLPVDDYIDIAQSVIQQADGKLVVAGYSRSTRLTGEDFSLTRLNNDGSLDTEFADQGRLIAEVGDYQDFGQSLIQQKDGKLVVAGFSHDSDGPKFSLIRVNSDGSFDTGFGTNGKVITQVGSQWDYGQCVIQQTDGKLVIAGYSYDGSTNDFSVIRLNPDGTPDQFFGNNGKLVIPVGSGSDIGFSVIQQTDLKILITGLSTGSQNEDFSLVRLNIDGSLDTSFGSFGKMIVPVGDKWDYGRDIIQQADGKLIIVGESANDKDTNDFSLIRLNSDGSLDRDFGLNGKLIVPVGDGGSSAQSVIEQSDGKLVLAGTSYYVGGSDFALIRLNSDGSLDSTFGPPENTLIQSGPAIYVEDSPPISLAPAAQIIDRELAVLGHYAGATLTLTRQGGSDSDDIFSNSGNLSTLNPGSYFSIDGTTIGRITSNGGGTLALSFNGNATQSLVNKAMQQIAYSNKSDAPPASVAIDWTFNDGNSGGQGTGGALRVTSTSTVNITAINDAPYLAVPVPDQRLAVDAPFSYQLPAGTFIDPDQETLNYTVVMADGTGVPPWLTFNRATQTFSGTPLREDIGSVALKIVATDTSGATAYDYINFSVYQNTAPTLQLSSSAPSAYESEYNDERTYADNFTNSVAGNLSNTSDVDWYSVYLGSGNTQAVTFDASSMSFGYWNVYWYNPDMQVMSGRNIDTAPFTYEFPTLTAGTYYLRVQAANPTFHNGGTYNVFLSQPEDYRYLDTEGDDTFGFKTGYLVGSDVDPDTTLSYGVEGGVISGDFVVLSRSLGEMRVQKSTGEFEFTPNKLAIESLKAEATQTFLLTVSDGSAVTTTPLDIKFNGVNDLPRAVLSIEDVALVEDQSFSLTVPLGTFLDADNATLAYSATLASGSPLPDWLKFDSLTSTFSGTTDDTAVGSWSVKVTAADESGATGSNEFTVSVTNINDLPSGSVAVNGTLRQGEVLTASNTLSDSDGLGPLTYNWKANGLSFATGSSITLGQSQVGKTITAEASYVDSHGTTERVSSAATGLIANVNDAPSGSVVIGGTPRAGELLTVSHTINDIDGLGPISYQWFANGTPMSGIEGNTLLLDSSLVGKAISVRAVYVDGGGTSETVSSLETAPIAPRAVPGKSISGTTAPDAALSGGDGPDTISGLAGNDTLIGLGGDDNLDGGGDTDTAVFAGGIAEYILTRQAASLTVTDSVSTRDGTDTLRNIERVKFADMGVSLTVQTTAASIDQASLDRLCELYLGFFARVPAADGLENWINQFKNGKSLNTIADDFYGIGSSSGLRAVTGYWDSGNNRELSDQDFVKIAYRNVLGREGLEGGINYWANQLSGPEAKTRGELVATMLDAAQGLTGDATWGWVAELLDDKVLMSKRVAVEWGLNYGANATEAIAKGVEIANAITTEANPAVPSIPIKRYDFDTAIDLVGVNPANIDLLIS